MFALYSIQRILNPKPVFLKPWVGMHNRPLSVYGYSVATTKVKAEVGTCAAIIVAQACRSTISLAIALAPQLCLNGCADACAASILAILSAIASQKRL